jgi:hypothetical protein
MITRHSLVLSENSREAAEERGMRQKPEIARLGSVDYILVNRLTQ